MFIAINRLVAKSGQGHRVEEQFAKSAGVESSPGFLSFELLKQTWGPTPDGEEYLVFTRWENREAFDGWVRSDAFKQAHSGGRPDFLTGQGHPAGYEVALRREPASR